MQSVDLFASLSSDDLAVVSRVLHTRLDAKNIRSSLGETPLESDLRALCPELTEHGLGRSQALQVLLTLAQKTLTIDHPLFLSFVPASPSPTSVLGDVIVATHCTFAGSFLEGGGLVFAEKEALKVLSDAAGLADAGGTFVTGGTAANLSALVAARFSWREKDAAKRSDFRGVILSSASVHVSVAMACRVMDAQHIPVEGDEFGRLNGSQLEAALQSMEPSVRERVFAVVCSAGTTNAGVVDFMRSVGEVCKKHSLWLHIDGAYGGACVLAPSVRNTLFDGIELCDSFSVDTNKWLFTPFDACALIYANPAVARRAHAQHCEVLCVYDNPDYNPSDYAIHLSRRARGVPLWLNFAAHGIAATRDALETTLRVAKEGASLIRTNYSDYLQLIMEPSLSVLLFRRIGWSPAQYEQWCKQQLEKRIAFINTTTWKGEIVLRLCLVNPLTTIDDLRMIFDGLK